MKTFLASTSIALLIASGALAQDAPEQEDQQLEQQQAEQPDEMEQAEQPDAQEEGQQQAGPFLQAGETDLFATQAIGIAVYAAEDGAAGQALDQADAAIDTAELAAFEQIGQVTDIMMTMDGELRGVVIGLGLEGEAPGAQPANGVATAPGAAAGPGLAGEVALSIDEIRFFYDQNAPQLVFAVAAVGAEEIREAEPVQRPQMVAGGTGPVAGDPAATGAAGGWMMGRQPMAAPGVAMDGYQQVPVAELSIDDLTGASVYGAEQEQIGSVNDVHLGQDGAVEYVTIDVGGFLGIGTHTVAVGFDEMTVMRDEGWDDLQVHISATQEDLEAMPEYEGG